jgi:hypothetical protein
METITRTRNFYKYDPDELMKELVCSADIIVFDGAEYESPELVWFKRGRVRISDNHQGLVDWCPKKKQYVRIFYGMSKPIGQLQYILIDKEQPHDQ